MVRGLGKVHKVIINILDSEGLDADIFSEFHKKYSITTEFDLDECQLFFHFAYIKSNHWFWENHKNITTGKI